MTATERVRDLNDRARRTFQNCRVVITPGIEQLDDLTAVLRAVQLFDKFTADNDPYAEHDFGAFHWHDVHVFWQFSYYDVDLQQLSPDPSDPAVTTRVLTVMLANEY
ncbi:hypothetical protein RAZWK3B_11732 [Roseobacter sp. AzwK-3b]|uniref:DUF3768 domain-containing protein n=1 Tax=Roseobacter sp. AzwK-3b TaxID=351016 RepID=UPI000156A1C6|nr:DUF3768 domain-containing protein [Roseobacter sp. AzwK-3b]EDM69407.1 hypothetical protein RAZWK3B_11732 [Roseobacter sp. AzwK-3b]